MGLDNQGSQPLYKQLEEKIIQDIENGIYRKGQKIPTEKELSQMYDVSRITVRKALEEITKQGILERHAGKGTYVASVKLQRSIATFMSFTECCEAQGLKPGARMIKNVIEDATAEDCDTLEIEPESKVLAIDRIRYADGVPGSLEQGRFTEDYFYLLQENLNDCSLFQILREKYGITLTSGKNILELAYASFEVSRYLQIPSRSPLLLMSGLIMDGNGKNVFYSKQYIVGDKFKFYL